MTSNFDFNIQLDKPAVKGAFIFEYNAKSPQNSSWRNTLNPLNVARLLADTVLLPNSTVFIINGISGGAAARHLDRFQTIFNAEIFDPISEVFTPVASNPRQDHPRGYYSIAVLLPNTQVAIAGNTGVYNPQEILNDNNNVSIQIYDPPYLFTGKPLVINSIPAQATYGSLINVNTLAGLLVASVIIIQPCAVMHSVDID